MLKVEEVRKAAPASNTNANANLNANALHLKEQEKLDYLAAKTKDLEQMNKHSEQVITAL